MLGPTWTRFKKMKKEEGGLAHGENIGFVQHNGGRGQGIELNSMGRAPLCPEV
jgi:hypothetical protein